MIVAFIIVNILSVIIETSILAIVYKTIAEYYFNKKLAILACIGLIVIKSIIINLVNIPILAMLISFILSFALSCFYKMSLSKRIVVTVLMTTAFVLAEMLLGFVVGSLSKATVEDTQKSIILYMECALSSKLIVLLLVHIFKSMLSKENAKLTRGMHATLILMPLATCFFIFVASELMYSNSNIVLTSLMIVAVISIITVNIIITYVVEKNIQQVAKEYKNQLYTQGLLAQTKYYQELISKYKIDNRKLHDIDNQFLVLQSMLEKDTTNIAKTELEEIGQVIKAAKDIGYTGIMSLDAILNNISNKIKDTDIQFNKHVFIRCLPEEDEMEFCLLIGNLLDNAVEEGLRLQKQNCENIYINCEIKQTGEYISILVENSKRADVEKEKTSKTNKFRHGYGIQIVKDIVAKFNGNIVFEQSLEIFSVMVVLAISKRTI